MEQNENTDQVLNRYFAKAGEEQPVMAIDEVKELISSTPANAISDHKMAEQVLAKFKYWLGGGLIVTAGIVVVLMSSGTDKQQATKNTKTTEPQIETIQNAAEPSATTEMNTKEEASTAINAAPDNNNYTKDITASKNDLSVAKSNAHAPQTKKESYYYPGAAQVNFEEDGKMIKMLIDDDVKGLEIDGVTITKNDYGSYAAIIGKGKAMKMESDRLAEEKANTESPDQQRNRNIMTALIKQLEADQLIDNEGHFEFRFTGFKLFINNEEQTESKFQQYRELYENVSGNKLTQKSNIRIKH